MNDLLLLATTDLARFLGSHLPGLAEDWWHKHVENRLSFQQQRMVQERGLKSLEQLDLAALLRVLDQNWYELSQPLNLPREGRNWVKELQTIRNKWAHLSAQTISPSEVYRDADTLGRFLEMLDARQESIAAVNEAKNKALANMAIAGGVVPTSTTSENETLAETEKLTSNPATMFKVGDLVALRSDPIAIMAVIEVIPGGAECRYVVFQNNKKVTYYESQLQPPEQTGESQPHLDVKSLHAYLTSLQLLSPSTANLYSLRSGRVQFVPYQYRPVLKLIRADRPRLLIADEVGVGKTIEAGLIIKELRARMDISSILIICPKALVAERKWFVEMKRFDEHFTALDSQMLRHCLKETHLEGEWPEQYARAIVPFSLFDSELIYGNADKGRRKFEGLLELDPPPKFDLVIVDEAHHIRNPDTYLHQAVRYFCDNSQAAIFLTATPVQLGSKDLYTLLNLLRPDLVIDHPSFEQMAEPNRFINQAVQLCRRAEHGWQLQARASMDEAAGTMWGIMFLRETPSFQGVYDQLGGETVDDNARIGIIRALEEMYTFSPMINRTRRRDIGEFTTRRPETISIEFTPVQQQLHDDLLDVVARILTFTHGPQNVKFMMTTIRRQAASCLYGLAPLLRNMLDGKLDSLEIIEIDDSDDEVDLKFVPRVRGDIEGLLDRVDRLDKRDPKVDAFVRVLTEKSRMPKNKSLVFSTFRHTLAYLEKYTRAAGLRYGLVNGDVPDEERAELRRRFALPKDDPGALDVLLSSEVGSEGLDFQFCDMLLNYDLPWNPMRIEQRIGRIDRYGQKSETVAIVNMITPGTVDADIYERCLMRIGVFQHAVGGSEEILGEITQEIHDIADSFTLTPEERSQRLQQLADNGIRIIQEEQTLEDKQAELFGLTVPGQSWRDEVDAAESYWLSQAALQQCVSKYLSMLLESDSEFLLGEKPLKTLRLNLEARVKLLEDFKRQARSTDPVARQWEKWLKGSDPMLQVTFDQETAATVPGVIHLNVLHPLVRQAAKYQERPEVVLVGLKAASTSLPAGEYPFAIYHWRKVGIKADDITFSVTTSPEIENQLLSMLIEAVDTEDGVEVDKAVLESLDRRHHSSWSEARANYITDNRDLVRHQLQSLNVSHQSRCKLLEDHIQKATNDKIQRMKESELARARQDYDRRVADLQKSADSADIHATPVVVGILKIISGG